MLPAQRLQKILDDLATHGSSTIAELSARYSVSEMTIRRDLKTLEDQGYIDRTHGGAIYRRVTQIEPHYASKQQLNRAQKVKLARYAATELVSDHDIIILEGGTTVTAMAPFLSAHRNLTIMTNGLYTTNELCHLLATNTIITSGGILRDVSYTFVGPSVENLFREFHAQKVFLSATGWTAETGYTDPSILEIQVKKAMIMAADQVIMLLDSSKFGVKSLTTLLGAFDADMVITDEGVPPEVEEQMRNNQVDLRIMS